MRSSLNTTAGCLPLPIPANEVEFEERCHHGVLYEDPCDKCDEEQDRDEDPESGRCSYCGGQAGHIGVCEADATNDDGRYPEELGL